MQNILRQREHIKKKSGFHKAINRALFIMTVPTVLWFIIFKYLPMFGVIIAFKDYTYTGGIWGSEWAGFQNFAYLFSSNDALRILRNTVLYNAAFIIMSTVAAIGVALLFDNLRSRRAIKFYQTTLFFPYFISWVVLAFVTKGLFDLESGILNRLLASFGLEKYSWYTETAPWPFIFILANIWKTVGYNSLIYYGAIIGIDPSIYEAAAIDGASQWQVVKSIKLPLIRSMIVIMFIMAIGRLMSADFGMFYYLPDNQGPLYPITDVMDTYIFRSLNVLGDIPSASAASVFQSVVGFALVLISNGIVKKVDPDNAMF